MEKVSRKYYYNYLLLVFPVISALIAGHGHGFIFKAGVAGSGIVIILFLFRKYIKSHPSFWFIIAAFAFSIAGDWFLSNKGKSMGMFSCGIGFFFLAHAGYLIFALANGRLKKILTAAILVVYLLFFYFTLLPAIPGNLLIAAVLLYLLISCFSLGAAAGIRLKPLAKWAYFAGIVLILFSDTIIAFHEFTPFQKLNFLILPTYYAAQISITLALIQTQADLLIPSRHK